MIVNLIQQHADQFARVGLHSLWQGTTIVVLATLTSHYFFKSPQQRSAVYLLSLVALALCIPATMSFLSGPGIISPETPIGAQHLEFTEAQPTISSEAIPAALPPETKTPLTVWLVGLYFLGLILMMARVIRGFFWSNKTRRQGTIVNEPEWTTALEQALARIKLRKPPVMFWSEAVSSPIVTGILRPMIVLPVSLMSGLPAEQAIAVLSHELAHLRRCDHIIVVFQRLLEALLFFHPAVWFLSRRLDQEREKACDDLVLNTGSNRAEYAEALVTIASNQKPPLVLAAAGNKQLTERVLRILNHRQPTTVRVNRGGWLTIAAAITLLGVFSFSPAQSQENENEEQGKSAEKVEKTALMKSLQINLPEMSLHNVTLVEALEFLRHRSTELHPDGQGINIVARNVAGDAVIDDLVLRNVTFKQAFKAICLKTGTQFTVEKFAVVVTPHQADQKAPVEKIAEPALMKKLQIKLPEMKLRNATLQETVEFLRLRSLELDPEPDPNKKGLNIVIRQLKDGKKNGDKIIDSLDFKNITLQQAFSAICLKTGMQYEVDEFAVTILPKQKAADRNPGMVQRSWAVPPDFLKLIAAEGTLPKSRNIAEHLEALAVSFPPETSAAYLSSSNTLLVRNTPDNLELIDNIVQASTDPVQARLQRARANNGKAERAAEAAIDKTLVQRKWTTPPDFFTRLAPKGVVLELKSTKAHLAAHGVTFPGASSAAYLKQKNLLIVRNTPANLHLIDKLILKTADPKKRDKEQETRLKQLDELNKIMIPRAIFKNTTLEEAVDFMRLRALELDPAKKGVNINFFGDKEVPDPVNLDLRNVPLPVLLNYVCNLTKTRYTIEGRNISILPANK